MDPENKHMNRKGEKGMGWTGKQIDTYTLLILFIKWITNKNLLYSTRNSIQCCVVTKLRRKFKREGIYIYIYMYIYMADSLHCTLGTEQLDSNKN